MPPRPRLRTLPQLSDFALSKNTYVCSRCQYATVTTHTPSSSRHNAPPPPPSMSAYPPSQPPSHRDPTNRKAQLLRSYVSLLQTTPLIILFQHNNLKSPEWSGIRRELAKALRKVDEQQAAQQLPGTPSTAASEAIKLQIIRTNMFEPALRIAEYYDPTSPPPTSRHTNPEPSLTHALSTTAYLASLTHRGTPHPLTPLLTGPIAALTFPTVSPPHLKAALSILSPQQPTFPPPPRRLNPGYWDPAVQDGLKKLLLLGARVEGRAFDSVGARWVGGIDGGIDGLRAQLVAMLQGFSGGLATTLEGAGRSVWFTMEGRRRMMEEELKPAETQSGEVAEKEEEA